MKKTAMVILIGDELLSGRTQDLNLQQIAGFLISIGVQLEEARIIGDDEGEIVAAVKGAAQRFDYVFTTGGIGPTHDDITAAAIAKAMECSLERNLEAVRMIKERFAINRPNEEAGEARLRMADIPQGALLIDNPVSGAPGFRIKNVFVLAGVPLICAAMLDSLAKHSIEGGERWISHTIKGKAAEGDVAAALEQIQQEYEGVKIGSYPSFSKEGAALRIVVRAPESLVSRLDLAVESVFQLMESLGSMPERE